METLPVTVKKLLHKTVGEAHAYGGLVEVEIEDVRLLFGDG